MIIHERPLSDGGKLLRSLYQSPWHLPAGDDSTVRIGLMQSRPVVRFRAPANMKIRATSEQESWDVASPRGVIWRVEGLQITRPGVVSYFPVVAHRLTQPVAPLPSQLVRKWTRHGYARARWIKPPRWETVDAGGTLDRALLALTPAGSKALAEAICRNVRSRWRTPCQTVGRVELPPLGRGRLVAENSTFAKEFEGMLELLSPRRPVVILDMIPEELTGKTSEEHYEARLFIVPGLDASLALVHSTTFRNYLEGVVPAEIFPRAPKDALRAQAIIARTYTLRQRHAHNSLQPFLLCASTNCQVYRGVTFRKRSTSKAVRDTRNFVVYERGGDLAETFYHAICGGHTEPRTKIWGPPKKSYLRGVSDQLPGHPFSPLLQDQDVDAYLEKKATAYCGKASFTRSDRWRWEKTLDEGELSRLASDLGLSLPLTDVLISRRSISGRALDLEVRNASRSKRVRGELRIRRLLGGIRSSLIVVEPTWDQGRITSLDVRGGAYGHGVGLCQMGAIGRAEAGQSMEEILSVYYPGTTVAPFKLPMLQ